MKGQLFIGDDITQDHDVKCDVCIVGSGAGGAVLAAGLVSSGLKVVMLEEGGYYDCLLYTSPSPRDATLSRMPSSA